MLRLRRQQGLTLLEVIVVIVIIGIVSTLFMPSMAQESAARKSVTQLFALMKAAADTSILTNFEVGLQLDTQGYRFFRWDDAAAEWRAITDDHILRPRLWPKNVTQELYMAGQKIITGAGLTLGPHIVFFAMGTLTPFDLRVSDTRSAKQYRLLAEVNGTVDFIDESTL